MAKGGVSTTLRRLLKQRRLLRARLGDEAIKTELEGAAYDLQRATTSLEEADFKWATVKAYYSMFHAARAPALQLRLPREKSCGSSHGAERAVRSPEGWTRPRWMT